MKKTVKKTVSFIVITAAILLAVCFPHAGAEVGFSSDGAVPGESIVIAGAPDNYPYEYYDRKTDTYRGMIPELLKSLSEKNGVSFTYVFCGDEDRRAELCRDDQVEIAFAFSYETDVISSASQTYKWISINREGGLSNLCCVFSEAADSSVMKKMSSMLDSVTDKQFVSSFGSATDWHENDNDFLWLAIVLGSLLFAAAVALLILAVANRRFKKKSDEDYLTDRLTNIGNNEFFSHNYSTYINDSIRNLYAVAYYSFDIAHINEFSGRDEADRLLRYAAEIISDQMEDNDFCARISGCSFAAAFRCENTEIMETKVIEVLRKLNDYDARYGKNTGVFFRAGVYHLSQDDRTAEKSVFNANQAYHSAVADKVPYVIANRKVLVDHDIRASMREQLTSAFDNHEFIPFIQFVVNASDGSIAGGEVLSRWDNIKLGLLLPEMYIADIVEMGYISKFDLFIFEETCRLLEAWKNKNRCFLSCNLSRLTVSDPTTFEKIVAIAGKYDFDREKLVLEITEDYVEEDKEIAIDTINRFREFGFRIALDDFSSGYTSVTNFYEYNVDIIKVDRRMLLISEKNSRAEKLFGDLVLMAHDFNVKVTVEGVENAEQNEIAIKTGCDYIQGFKYSRPIPLREIETFLNKYDVSLVDKN